QQLTTVARSTPKFGWFTIRLLCKHSAKAGAICFDSSSLSLFNFSRYSTGSFAMSTRREFLTGSAAAVATVTSSQVPAADSIAHCCSTEFVSLCGDWLFRTDPADVGRRENWVGSQNRDEVWRKVVVPHTCQVEAPLADYRGVAWYQRSFDAPTTWGRCVVRMEFEAVFHSAIVWVNGELVGEHARKGYTAFNIDITPAMQVGRTNTIAVRVDSEFNQSMVPRGRSSDWAHDGGIFRPVQILLTAPIFVEQPDVEAVPDLASGEAALTIAASIRNTSSDPWKGKVWFRISEECSSSAVWTHTADEAFSIEAKS